MTNFLIQHPIIFQMIGSAIVLAGFALFVLTRPSVEQEPYKGPPRFQENRRERNHRDDDWPGVNEVDVW